MNLQITPPPCGCIALVAAIMVAVVIGARCWAAVLAAPYLLP